MKWNDISSKTVIIGFYNTVIFATLHYYSIYEHAYVFDVRMAYVY